MDYAHLTDADLQKLTRRRLQERPSDPQSWQANIDELRALAAVIAARVEQR
jgi:hypothetical protein